MHTPSRRPVHNFLETGHFKGDSRKIPPDHTVIPHEFLPEGTAVPSHRALDPTPRGNPRPRFLKRDKIKWRRSRYWDLAVRDAFHGNERRAKRVLRVADLLREGWTPSSLLEAGYKQGTYWRAVHMQHRMKGKKK